MAQLLIRHKVADYGKWKPIFDRHAAVRRMAGITGGRLWRNAKDPQEILILFDTNDVEKTLQFTQSEDLRNAMQEAGVIDAPDMFLLEEIEQFSDIEEPAEVRQQI